MFSSFNDNNALSSTLRDYIERKLQPYGLPEYAYTVLSKKDPSKVLIITSYPSEWEKVYRDNHFHQIDPVILAAFRRISPFSWDENITLMNEIRVSKIFTLSKQFNVVNGFTFVLHDHLNNVALLSLIIQKQERVELEQTIRGKGMGQLQLALIEIHEQMMKLLQTRTSKSPQGMKPMGESNPIFTPKENEVLYWASMGKTYTEIAKIMGITFHTVKFHMGNLVKKMNVSNARQAIRLGVELNLISTKFYD